MKSKCYVSAFGQTYEKIFLKFAFKGVKWNLGSLKAPKAKQWHENCCFPFFRLSLCGKRLFDHRLLDGRLEYVLASCVTDYRGGLFLFIQQWTHFRSLPEGTCARSLHNIFVC